MPRYRTMLLESNWAPLVLVLAVSLAVLMTWIFTIAEAASTPDESFRVGTKLAWVLIILFTGVIGSVTYLAVGRPIKKGAVRSSAPALSANWKAVPPLVGGHAVSRRSVYDAYLCQEAGCGFRSWETESARAHRVATGGVPAAEPAKLGFGSPSEPSAQTSEAAPSSHDSEAPTPEFKTCPDCAEQVRYAARKCRYCSYSFLESRTTV